MVNTEAIIKHAIQENVKLTLVVNKIDRLILELRIKPADAYYKIKHTIEEVNTFIRWALSIETTEHSTQLTLILSQCY